MITRAQRHIVLALPFMVMTLLATGLFVSCSANDGTDTPTHTGKQEINFNADVRNMAEGTRATTIDNTYMAEAENGFICTAYNANSTVVNSTANINATTVTWNDSKWTFADGSRYWPLPSTPGDAYPSLDFFAYMPKSIPSYITNMSDEACQITYAARNPQFKCVNLPSTAASQSSMTEFVFALTTGQNKTNAASGVALNFTHPFTRINLQLSAGHPAIHINTITFKTIKNNGTYNNGWTPSGADTDFEWAFNDDYDNHESDAPLALGGSCFVIPQDWAGEIEVNATWKVWDEDKESTVSTDLTGTIAWQSGKNYTYTFTITETDLIVNTSKFTEQW